MNAIKNLLYDYMEAKDNFDYKSFTSQDFLKFKAEYLTPTTPIPPIVIEFFDAIIPKSDYYKRWIMLINKTDSAIRLTHYETGIVVSCQDERSQHANLDKALRLLKAKLLERQRLAQEEEINGIRGEQQDNGWGSQIRSYVFAPYKLVKDHRTQVEVGNVDAVMDGDIDAFIFGYLKSMVKSEA